MGLLSALFRKRVKVPTVLVTLDALGTLYTFRQPVAVQYLQVARACGLEAKLDSKELDSAFRQSFKHHNTTYPNYGKDNLESPEVWWDLAVRQAFSQVVKGAEPAVPPNLSSALYNHFSSGAAYELFPDVKPFLRSMAALKKRFTDSSGPIVLTGIVTNSDPRVELVLRDMGFRLGPSRLPDFKAIRSQLVENAARDIQRVESIFRNYYQITNDFDIVSTSYDAGVEKPEAGIWRYTEGLTTPTVMSRGQRDVDQAQSFTDYATKSMEALKYGIDHSKTIRIHIGDEYPKDYVGATDAGWEALHLARQDDASKDLGRNVTVVRSLDEVAMIVNVMANELLEQARL